MQPLTANEYNHTRECITVLSSFNDAASELSEEKRVSGSKVIPLLKMIDHSVQDDMLTLRTPKGLQLGENPIRC